MYIAYGFIAHIGIYPFDGLAYDRGAQMPHMQGLGHIGAAIVHHHRLRRGWPGHAVVVSMQRLHQVRPDGLRGECQVDEARLNRLRFFKKALTG